MLCSIFGGSFVTGVISGVHAYMRFPFEWKFTLVVFALSSLGLAVLFLVIARPKIIQPSTQMAVSPPAEGHPLATAIDDSYRTYDRTMSRVVEQYYIGLTTQVQAGDQREQFMIRVLSFQAIYGFLESTWFNIFGSQIRALQRVNQGPAARDELFVTYALASVEYPKSYANYPFESWIGWLRDQALICENGSSVNITVRGQEFLKHLITTRRSAEMKSL
jgi:hypothetical protein